MNHANAHSTYDAIIVGGAMAGVCMALALSSRTHGRLRLAIVERYEPKHHQIGGFDGRSIALSYGSCAIFSQIFQPSGMSLWQKLAPLAQPIDRIQVSDQGHFGRVQFNAETFALPHLGAVIPLETTGQVLLDALQEWQNVDYLAPTAIQNIHYHADYVQVQLADRTLQTKLIIGADGTFSQVAKNAGIQAEMRKDFQQSALIANVKMQASHHNCAFERFTSQGPLALLPLKMPNQEERWLSLVWCRKDAEYLQNLYHQSPQNFCQQLQQAFGWQLGKIEQCTTPAVYPLKLYQAPQAIQHRTALIANANQSLHPVAGQGFNLGLRDIFYLTETLAQSHAQGADIGLYRQLLPYEKQSRADQQKIVDLTKGLVNIFSNNIPAYQLLRNIGLTALAQSATLQHWFAEPLLGQVPAAQLYTPR